MSHKNVLKAQKKRAEKLLSVGKLPEARLAFVELCKLNSNDFQSWLTSAMLATRLKNYPEAATAYQHALKLNPNLTDAYFELAQTQATMGRFTEAQQNYRAFLMMCPDSDEGYKAYAKLLKRWGRLTEATENYRKAAELNSGDIETLLELGSLLQQQGLFDEALIQFNKAKQIKPELAHIYNQIASLYRDTNKPELALQHYRKAYELAPMQEASYEFYLGTVYESQGDTDTALNHFDKAIQCNPELAEAHLSRAVCLLKKGEFKQGWAEHEWRRYHPNWLQQRNHQIPRIPLWDGKASPDKTILVVAEQGYGDVFQFSRYLPQLAKLFAKVIVRSKPEDATLLASIEGVDAIITGIEGINATQFHAHLHLMSLPYYFGTTLETIPAKVPYLHAPADTIEHWHEKIGSDGFKIGLVWAGSPSNVKNQIRNIQLADLAPLGEIPGIRFFGLQKGPGSEQAASPPGNMDFTFLGDGIKDFADTAAVISNLDLVISVDTATAHLAGALAKPVWTLLYFPSEWRWLERREDSPWYPSMRLFRQNSDKDWMPVIKRVADELRRSI